MTTDIKVIVLVLAGSVVTVSQLDRL